VEGAVEVALRAKGKKKPKPPGDRPDGKKPIKGKR
jgi:hypothetical protein